MTLTQCKIVFIVGGIIIIGTIVAVSAGLIPTA